MTTRGLFTFKGHQEHEHDFNVYKHHDTYPSGALVVLQNTIDWFAWKLPRYESDEFAAAFCAAGKAYYMIEAMGSEEARIEYNAHYSPHHGDRRASSGGGVRLMPDGDPLTVASKECCDIDYRYEISFNDVTNSLDVKAFKIGNHFDDKGLTDRCIFDGTFTDFGAWASRDEADAA